MLRRYLCLYYIACHQVTIARDNSCHRDETWKWETEAGYMPDGTYSDNRQVSTLSLCFTGWLELHREVAFMRIASKHHLNREEDRYFCQPHLPSKRPQNQLNYIKPNCGFFSPLWTFCTDWMAWNSIFWSRFNTRSVYPSFSEIIPVSNNCNLVQKINSAKDWVNVLYTYIFVLFRSFSDQLS